MNVIELLKELSSKQIKLETDGENIKYRTPKGVMTEDILKTIKIHKSSLIELLSKPAGSLSIQSIPFERIDRDSTIVTSFAQDRLLFIDEYEGSDSASHNIPWNLHLSGHFDTISLKRALNTIIQRHESLRTIFCTKNGIAKQIIKKTLSLDIPVINVTDDQVDYYLQRFTKHVFDLKKGPLIKAGILRLSAEEHIFLLNIHHIVTDGWSMIILLDELKHLYKAYTQQYSPSLTTLTYQYADYAAWQKKLPNSGVLNMQLEYWVNQLKNVPALLKIPYDRDRPKQQRFQGNTLCFQLPKRVHKDLNQLSQSEGATLFMILLAGFYFLLSRYSDQTDICIGTPIAHRQRQELNNLIGFFVNTLPMRIKINPEETPRHLLKQVKTMALAAYSNQDIPFEYLVEKINPERSTSYSPLFQYMFSLQNVVEENFEFSGIKARLIKTSTSMAKFDMSLTMTETPNGISGAIEYNTDLFDDNTVKTFCNHYQQLLANIKNNFNQKLRNISLLSEKQLLHSITLWNNTDTPYPKNVTIQCLFEAQAEKTPDTIALRFKNHILTYRELNEKSNQLAHHLIANNIDPGDKVGICLDKSTSMIIGIMGILKSGGSYVPIDPQYPQHRINNIIDDSQMAALVTQTEAASTALNDLRILLICVDDEQHTIEKQPKTNPVLNINSLSIAYVIYTSGSMGKPKGVAISHRAVSRLVIDNSFLLLNANEKILQLSSISFDAATFEIWGALLNGNECVIYPDRRFSLNTLYQVVMDCNIDILFLTTSIFNLVIDEQPGIIKKVSKILTGGEAISRNHVKRAYELSTHTTITHVYGPTESTTFAIYHSISRQTSSLLRNIPLGLPISNTYAYVLDNALNIVPIGVTGELYLGGDGLAQGYLNQPGLTAEHFVPNPFSSSNGGRLYKSGDRVTLLASGELEFVERVDLQVKIRGFRIEPAEIEHVLLKQPDVCNATVVAYKSDENSNYHYLAAYVVCQNTFCMSKRMLSDDLKLELPDYMIPTAFIFLEQLPLTPNGKVDRQALPSPDKEALITRKYIAPQTTLETALTAIWAQSLQLETTEIGIHDNFFDLGGHSLLATQVVVRVREHLRIELTLKAFFAQPTIFQLGNYLQSQNSWQTADQSERMQHLLVTFPHSKPPQLSFAQQRLWFINQYENQIDISYNMPVTLCLFGELNVVALRRSINALVARHETLRTTFQLVEGQPVQMITPNLTIPLLVTDVAESEVTGLIEQHTHHVFNLFEGPLFITRLLRIAENQYYLLINMHHIISDGWSFGVFNRELASLYAAFKAGRSNPLSILPIQYADFAHWQRQWLRGEILNQQAAYWEKQLADLPAYLHLPTDKPRPEVLTLEGQHIRFSLSAKLSHRISMFCQQENVTLFMLTLSVFHILLSRYSGNEDVFVGSAVANRVHPKLELLIGFFVNVLVLRSRVDADLSFQDYLQKVKTLTLDAYDHQDIPFESIVERLQPDRSTAHHPLFNISFAVQNASQDALELEEVSVTSVDSDFKTAKYDLFLQIYEGKNTNTGEELHGSLEYNTNLFEQASAYRLIGHYKQLLEEVITSPRAQLKTFNIVTKQDHQKLLVDWNNTDKIHPYELCIHELFEAQAEQRPTKTALTFGNHSLSYSELNNQSNRLAHFLCTQGVTPDTLIGVCIERSFDMVIAILAILKAGGAYVPLDPTYPCARLTYILEDTQLSLLLTQSHLRQQLPITDQQLIYIDVQTVECGVELKNQPTHNIPTRAAMLNSQHIAYIIYTSGSTGKPKGVMLEHSGLVNLALSQRSTFLIHPTSNILQFASLSFDAATWEIFMALANGAVLHLLSEEHVKNPEHLTQKIQNNQITHATLPPAILDSLSCTECVYPKQLIVAGEAITLKTANAWSKNRTLFNAYGPTESTVCVSIGSYSTRHTSIGRPINNIKCYVLDKFEKVCPIGVPGELYVGGVGIARGYLNRADLTAEKFVVNPFSGNTSDRLYRTGDLVRWLDCGNLEFIGRIDEQLKIRGFRIECGEIEHTLQQHKSVTDSIVVARENTLGGKRLIAYVINANNEQLQDTEQAQVTEWQTMYDEEVYQTPSSGLAQINCPADNFNGWFSSYDNTPIPLEHMRAWAKQTASRIVALSPKNVLDIGCGTGLLLFRLLPNIKHYTGSDFSKNALQQISKNITSKDHKKVELLCCEAIDFNKYNQNTFDTIILNSITQYFPSGKYLLQVLGKAISHLTQGGSLFIGDVRHYDLLNTFATSVTLFNADAEESLKQLQHNIALRKNNESELLISPLFFSAIKKHFPRISHIEILPKFDTSLKLFDNELFHFRYDVILHIEENSKTNVDNHPKIQWFDWSQDIANSNELRSILSSVDTDYIGIKQIPNSRLQETLQCQELLSNNTISTVAELRNLTALTNQQWVSMETLIQIGRSLGYVVEPSWINRYKQGEYDLLLQRSGCEHYKRFLHCEDRTLRLDHYYNNPLRTRQSDQLTDLLRGWLKTQLPSYMLPSSYVYLDRWPLTPNGKIDKKALPDPNILGRQQNNYEPAQTPVQRTLVEIWEKVLDMQEIGIHDNFFEIGGHSLLATQIISRTREKLLIPIQIRDLFSCKSIINLALVIEEMLSDKTENENIQKNTKTSDDINREEIII